MIQPLLFQSAMTDLTNRGQTIHLLDTANLFSSAKNEANMLQLSCQIRSEMNMPDQKTLYSSAIGPLHLDLKLSSKESTITKDNLVYHVGRITPENHIMFYLKDENSRCHSKYYFLRCGKKYKFYTDEFYENHLETNKNLYTNSYMVLPLVTMSAYPKTPVKVYSMHVEVDKTKIKEYDISLKGVHLTIKRTVIHTLNFCDEKKWNIEKELHEIVREGVYKSIYAKRSIQRYFKAVSG